MVYMKFYVNLYSVGRAYGGPEEGGWHYDYGEFQRTLAIVPDEDQAYELYGQVCEQLRQGKNFDIQLKGYQMGNGPMDGVDPATGECDDYYLQLGGQWGNEEIRCVVENHAGQDFPQERPHYE